MRRRLSLLLASVLAAGCVTPTYHEGQRPLSVTQDSFFDLHFSVHKPISREELEDELCTLAVRSTLEDAWLFCEKEKTLVEAGYDEESRSAELVIPPEILRPGETYEIIHIHPLQSQIFNTKGEYEPCLEALASTHNFGAIPSGCDVRAQVELSQRFAKYDATIISSIVDYAGVLSFTVEHQDSMTDTQLENLVSRVDEIFRHYHSFSITKTQSLEQLRHAGLHVEYRRVRKESVEVLIEVRENFFTDGTSGYAFTFKPRTR